MDDRGVFVDRDGDLATLRRELERARAGEPSVVLIEGPAGIGKTALVAHFLASGEGMTVVRASGEESETTLAYGVLGQLVAGLGADPGELPPDPLDAGIVLLRMLGEAAGDGVTVLHIDDVQWVDSRSIRALVFAVRRLRADHVLVVLCARDDAGLDDSVRRLVAPGRGAHIVLEGLPEHDVALLASEMGLELAPPAAQRLVAHTGGNPLHIRALLTELPPDVLRDPTASTLPAPRSFSLLVLQRLAEVSSACERLVAAAAVLGMSMVLSVVAALAEVDDPLPAVDEARDAGILTVEQSDRGTRVAFAHPLIRASVYDSLGAARRSTLHRGAADVLEGAEALRHRLAAVTGTDEELAADLVRQAGDDMMRSDFATAGRHIVAASDVMTPGAERDRALMDGLGLLIFAGEVALVAQHIERVRALPPSARRTYLLGHYAQLTTQPDAVALLERAWDEHDPATELDVAAISATLLSNQSLMQNRGTEGAEWASRALATGALPPLQASLAMSSGSMGMAIAGRWDEAFANLAHLPDDPSTVEPHQAIELMTRGALKLWTDDIDGAIADLRQMSVIMPSTTFPFRLNGLGLLADADFRRGYWESALSRADLALSIAEDSDQSWLMAFLGSQTVLVLAAQGRFDEALQRYAEILAAPATSRDSGSAAYVANAGAALAYARNDWRGVLDAVEPLLDMEHREGMDEPGVQHWHAPRIEALVALGRLDDAEEALVPFEERARDRGRRSTMAAAARARGVLESMRGDAEAATTAFRSALSAIDPLPMPYERALIELAYGKFLRREGLRRQAAGFLQDARDRFAELGAAASVDEADRELRACGLEPSRRRTRDPSKLTPQELAVAQLVAGGLSNRDVADQLVVSVKTVEFHLSHVYAKLGIRSRTQLAARIGGEG